MKNKKIILTVAFCSCAIVFLFALEMFIGEIMGREKEKSQFVSSQQLLAQYKQEAAQEPAAEQQEDGRMLPWLAPFYEKNTDLIGWVSIKGTSINYPVVWSPGDPEYYLRRSFEKEYSQSGVPFLDAACDPEKNQLLIYGHNMRDGSMFTPLLSYQNEEFWKEHPTISFDMLSVQGEYEVVAAFFSQIYYANQEEGFRYYQYTDLSSQETFEEFAEQVKLAALYDTGNKITYGDKLLTLSTCSYHTGNGRFVVVAKKVEAQQQ